MPVHTYTIGIQHTSTHGRHMRHVYTHFKVLCIIIIINIKERFSIHSHNYTFLWGGLLYLPLCVCVWYFKYKVPPRVMSTLSSSSQAAAAAFLPLSCIYMWVYYVSHVCWTEFCWLFSFFPYIHLQTCEMYLHFTCPWLLIPISCCTYVCSTEGSFKMFVGHVVLCGCVYVCGETPI